MHRPRSLSSTLHRLLLLASAIVILVIPLSAKSQIYMSGTVSYTLTPPIATLSVYRIYNDYWWTSGTLKLELWATPVPFASSTSGYLLADASLGQLSGYSYLYNVNKTDFNAVYPGAPGVYYMTVVLREFTASGYVIVDYLQFSGTTSYLPPTVVSSGSTSGQVGQSFSYQIIGTQSPTGYGASGLPPGLAVNPSTGLISGTPTSSGTYYPVVWAANYWGTGTKTVTMTIAPNITPPSIIWGPQSITKDYGATTTLGVSASGTLPLSYQWRKNSVDIPGATSSFYQIPYTTTADAGSYSVRVSNAGGSTTSSSATLTVNSPVAPSFDTQPQSISSPEGSTVFLLTAASGTGPLNYQWWKGTSPISGATNPVYSISNLSEAQVDQYRVTVNNLVATTTSQWAYVAIDHQAISRTASAKVWNRSVLMGEIVVPWVVDSQNYGNLYDVFTTYDGLSSFPLNQLGENPASPFNTELRPKTGAANTYEADFATYSDYLAEWIDWGWINSTINSPDSDGNGLPDLCQYETAVNVSFSASSQSDTDGDTSTFNGTMSRNANSQLGSYSATEASSGVTVTGVWGVVNISGVVSYTKGLTNSIQLSLVANDGLGNLSSIYASTTFNVISADQIVLPSFVVSGEDNASTTVLGPAVFNRTGNRFIGNLTLTDGNTDTPWPDFTQWVMEFVDSNDQDSDGIPDLTDGLRPVILTQPQSSVVGVGGTISLAVEAVGPGVLDYQWRKDGVNITGAKSPSWSIINAQPSDEGSYTVRIANSAGMVLSDAASVTITVPAEMMVPTLPSPDYVRSQGFPVRINVLMAGDYSLEASTNLVDWTTVASGSLGVGVTDYLDTSATNHGKRFYRVLLQ